MYYVIDYVLNVSYKRRLLSIDDIDSLISYFEDIYRSSGFVRNVSFDNKTPFVAAYIEKYRVLIINYLRIIKKILLLKDRCKFKNDTDLYIFLNLSIVQYIMHEFEHVNQFMLIENNDNTLYSSFLNDFSVIPDKERKKYYELCPEERMAEILSYNKIFETITVDDVFHEDVIDAVYVEKLYRLLRGYNYYNEKFHYPTVDYLDLLGYNLDVSYLDKLTDFNERLFYGIHESDELLLSLKSEFYSKNDKSFVNRIKLS